jgi:hypothetical protein
MEQTRHYVSDNIIKNGFDQPHYHDSIGIIQKNKNGINRNMNEHNYLSNRVQGNNKKNKNLEIRTTRSKKNRFRPNKEKSLLDVSEKITDNSHSLKRILKENHNLGKYNKDRNLSKSNLPFTEEVPAYFTQFDAQTFDSESSPGAVNDIYFSNDKSKLADLERKISYHGGWTQYDQSKMTYGIIPDDQFVHNNMMPFFNTKNGYGSNDLQNDAAINYKNELFTGSLKTTYNNKKEVEPLFSPIANLSYVYGTPNWSEEEKSRFIPGRYYQNEKPFDEKRITPGLNLEANEIGMHGYHSMYRSLDKTIDELRVNPKITYEGRIIEGRKGQERPLQAPVISYRPETYKTTTKDDLLPTDNVVNGPKTRDNFIMKDTDRSKQHFEYTGGAFTKEESVGKNIPEHLREKYKDSTKSTFILPKPLQKFSRTETCFNPNIKSYDLSSTVKDLTINNNYIGQSTNALGGTFYTNFMDIAKPTLKEQTSTIPQTYQSIAPNTMRGTVQPMDITNPTIKETTIENKLNPHVASLNTMQRVYNNDIARATMKETSNDPIVPMNVANMTNIYANITDQAKETMKEITVQIPYQTVTTPINQQQRAPNPQDIARSTVKETTVQIPYQSTITPINQQQRAPNLQDIAKSTVKETTVQIPFQSMVTPIDQQQRTCNPMDIARQTVKETTVNIPYQTIITPVNQQQRTVNPYDIAKSTIKETTVQIPYQTMMTPINQQQRAANYQDIAKSTTKETTVQIPYQTILTPVNQQQRAVNYQDIAKSTTKETTVQIPYQTILTPVNQQQRAPNYQDISRPTVKETTVEIPRETIITPINQQQRVANLQDITRSTTKETTVQIPYQNIITPIGQQQRAPDYQDIARSTVKEITVQTPWNNFILPVGQQQRAPDPQDVTRPTIKETTVQIPYQSVITPVGQQQRTANPQDVMRPTIKETTVQIPYNMNTTAIDSIAGQASSFNRSPLKTTTKEQTINIPYNTHMVAVGQAQRTPNPTDKAKPTIKETTVEIPYNTSVVAVGQSQRTPNPTDIAKTTLKEQTVQIPYNTHTVAIGQYGGQANSFNRTPLKSTIKETTLDNEHVGAANGDVSGKGYGYITEKMYAPNTNKQFTCQEVYIQPAKAESKNRSYNDAYNAKIDGRKDVLHWYYEPTKCGINAIPDPENINVRLRNDNNQSTGPIIGYSINNKLDRLKSHSQIRSTDQINGDRFIDPMLLKQLESNPYHIIV